MLENSKLDTHVYSVRKRYPWLKLCNYEQSHPVNQLVDNNTIWDALLDLVPFENFESQKKHPCRNFTFSKADDVRFSCFLNCTNNTKLRKSPHIFLMPNLKTWRSSCVRTNIMNGSTINGSIDINAWMCVFIRGGSIFIKLVNEFNLNIFNCVVYWTKISFQ